MRMPLRCVRNVAETTTFPGGIFLLAGKEQKHWISDANINKKKPKTPKHKQQKDPPLNLPLQHPPQPPPKLTPPPLPAPHLLHRRPPRLQHHPPPVPPLPNPPPRTPPPPIPIRIQPPHKTNPIPLHHIHNRPIIRLVARHRVAPDIVRPEHRGRLKQVRHPQPGGHDVVVAHVVAVRVAARVADRREEEGRRADEGGFAVGEGGGGEPGGAAGDGGEGRGVEGEDGGGVVGGEEGEVGGEEGEEGGGGGGGGGED